MATHPFDAAADRGIAFLKSHPGLSIEFNVYSSPHTFPPIVEPANTGARELDDAISGNEGFSGAGYFAAFDIFLRKALADGYELKETPRKTLVLAPK